MYISAAPRRRRGMGTILDPSTLFNSADYSLVNPLGQSNTLLGIGDGLISGIPDILTLGVAGVGFLLLLLRR